jgi:hypothetical protein
LVFSVALCDLCGEKGLVSGFPNIIVFALLPHPFGRGTSSAGTHPTLRWRYAS